MYQHAADVRYHLDCWLVWACLPGAIVTTITTSMVCCKCNIQHRWLDIAITNINAGLMQVYQICMLVGTGLQIYIYDCWLDETVEDMGNGQTQLLQTWLMVGCKCNILGS